MLNYARRFCERARFAFIVALLALFITVPADAASRPVHRLISVDAFVRSVGSSNEVVATIRNLTKKSINLVHVDLWVDDRLAQTVKRSSLHAYQSMVAQFATTKPNGSYLIVVAREGKVRDKLAVSPANESTSPQNRSTDTGKGSNTLLVAVVSAIFSLVGAVLGVILTHVTTSRREKEKMRFEAAASDTERYTPAYREFLDYWKMSIIADQLETGFMRMRGKAYVPLNVLNIYEQSITTLRDVTAADDAKRAAAQRLYTAIDELTSTKVGNG